MNTIVPPLLGGSPRLRYRYRSTVCVDPQQLIRRDRKRRYRVRACAGCPGNNRFERPAFTADADGAVRLEGIRAPRVSSHRDQPPPHRCCSQKPLTQPPDRLNAARRRRAVRTRLSSAHNKPRRVPNVHRRSRLAQGRHKNGTQDSRPSPPPAKTPRRRPRGCTLHACIVRQCRNAAGVQRCGAAGKARHRQIKAAPKKMHGTHFA